jgi:DNA polymerase-3 subunit delta
MELDGRRDMDALESGFPRLHFSRKALVETALRNLDAARLTKIIAQLADAALDMRKQSALADIIAQRALLSVAVNARRRG